MTGDVYRCALGCGRHLGPKPCWHAVIGTWTGPCRDSATGAAVDLEAERALRADLAAGVFTAAPGAAD